MIPQGTKKTMYQTGGTIKETPMQIRKANYVLPAIQREIVRSDEQIARLGMNEEIAQ